MLRNWQFALLVICLFCILTSQLVKLLSGFLFVLFFILGGFTNLYEYNLEVVNIVFLKTQADGGMCKLH